MVPGLPHDELGAGMKPHHQRFLRMLIERGRDFMSAIAAMETDKRYNPEHCVSAIPGGCSGTRRLILRGKRFIWRQ